MIHVRVDLDCTVGDPQGSVFKYYCAAAARRRKRKYGALKLATGITALDRIHQNLIAMGDDHDEETVRDVVQAVSDLAVQHQRSWSHLMRPLPGAVELLRQLHVRDDVSVGTVTANMRGVAHVKLSALGVAEWVNPLVSAYGEEAWTRAELVSLSLRRAGADPADAVVLGDTVQDILAARGAGTRVVAVVSEVDGRAALEAAEPDVLLDDLTDTDAVLAALLGHVPSRTLVAA